MISYDVTYNIARYIINMNDTISHYHAEYNLISVEINADLSDVFLHEFRADDTNKTCVSSVSNGTCTQSLASPRRAKQQHTLRRVNAQVHKPLRLQTTHKIFCHKTLSLN